MNTDMLLKLKRVFFLMIIITVMLTGCGSSKGENNTADTPSQTSDMVLASILEKEAGGDYESPVQNQEDAISGAGLIDDGQEKLEEKMEKVTAENESVKEDNAESSTEALDENLKLAALYVKRHGIWEPKDRSACHYAWSDIDGNGQPELFIAEQKGEGNGYEIHIFMIEEDERGIWDVSASDSSGIPADSLPINGIWRDYSTGVSYYSDDSTYFYYAYSSSMLQRDRFCREEDSVFYDSDGNEITFARWQNLNTVYVQGKILSAEKLVWKEIDIQSGSLSVEEIVEEFKTSYMEYLLSAENRDMEEIIDSFRLPHALKEEEEEILLREFTEKVKRGESAQIVFRRYTSEHIPVPVYIDYNGDDFYGIWDESKDPYTESVCPYHGFRYNYLKVFSETGEDGIIHETAVLTNEEDLSWGDLSWEDLTSTDDKAGKYPDYLTLYGSYGDLKTKDALRLATDAIRIEKGDFIKRDGVYLIEDGAQLKLLSEMVVKGEEIEEGIEAAIGVYRLCSDVEVKDCLTLGSRRAPFLGGLYGDGHLIIGSFSFIWESMEDWNYFDYNCVRESPVSIEITIEDAETLEGAEQTLIPCPAESLVINVAAEEPDMRAAAELIKQCWEVNHENNHYFVSITDTTEQTEKSDALRPFLDLFGEEGGVLMEQTAKEEDSSISFIRLERVGGLDICTFAVRASEKEQYHLMFAGEWEETEVSFGHLLIPAVDSSRYGGLFGRYKISQVDVNFDGKEDLLIHEGDSGGSGGTFCDHRAAVWKEDAKEFVWYPSFPELLVVLEFNEQRMINRYQLGAPYEVVCEYSVVDGEYVKTRELRWDHGLLESILYYYEMDVLVERHDVTDMDRDEVISLYPDLDYWMRG